MIAPAPPVQLAAHPPDATVERSASAPTPEPGRPAATAAGRAFAAVWLLGVLGLVSAVAVITRLLESWRLTSGTGHVISLFGQRLSYPAANTGAIVVTALAGLGLLMASAAGWRAARELIADRRFGQTLAARAPRPLDGAWVIDEGRPQAFCAGLVRPRVYVSSGALELLDGPGLAAVLAHEREHARRHDPLRLACVRVLLAGLFFIPALRRLASRQQALSELSADEAAVLGDSGGRAALASAMLSFSEARDEDAAGVDPERIDHLLGEGVQWGLPLALCLGAAAGLTLLIAVALLAGQVAAGSATLAPPFLSSQPCVAVLAMIPTAAAVAAVVSLRARRAPQVTAVAPAFRQE
jgi:bla regulator protein blaR1